MNYSRLSEDGRRRGSIELTGDFQSNRISSSLESSGVKFRGGVKDLRTGIVDCKDVVLSKVNLKGELLSKDYTSEFVTALVTILPDCTMMESLSLAHNKFTDNNLSLLINAVIANSSLKALDLSGNHFKKNAATAMVGLLSKNTIETLILDNICDNIFVIFADALKNNTSLKFLKITASRVKLDKASYKLITDIITSNKYLLAINLDGNNYANKDMQEKLATAIENNNTLLEFTLPGSSYVGINGRIERALQRNYDKVSPLKKSSSYSPGVASPRLPGFSPKTNANSASPIIDSPLSTTSLTPNAERRVKRLVQVFSLGLLEIQVAFQQHQENVADIICLKGEKLDIKVSEIKRIKEGSRRKEYEQFISLFTVILKIAHKASINLELAKDAVRECKKSIATDFFGKIVDEIPLIGDLVTHISVGLREEDTQELARLAKITGTGAEIDLLAGYIARKVFLNEVVNKYYRHTSVKPDGSSDIANRIVPHPPKYSEAVVDMIRILVKSILSNEEFMGMSVITVDTTLGDDLRDMITEEVEKREKQYIWDNDFGVGLEKSIHSSKVAYRHRDAYDIRPQDPRKHIAIDMEDRPGASPSSPVKSNWCNIL